MEGKLKMILKNQVQVPSDMNNSPSIKLGTDNNGILPSISSKQVLSNLGTPDQKNILNPPFVSCKGVFSSDKSQENGTVVHAYGEYKALHLQS